MATQAGLLNKEILQFMWLVVSRKMLFQGWRDPGAAAAFSAPSWALPSLKGNFLLRLAARQQQSRALQSQTATLVASRLGT